MTSQRWCVATALSILLLALPARAFDLEAYRSFLATNADLSTAALLDARVPAAPYEHELRLALEGVSFLPEVSTEYGLTEDELLLLGRHGFMVSERLAQRSYGDALLEIWHADLPLFISSDLILHSVHRSFLNVMMMIEEAHLMPRMQSALATLHAALPLLEQTYAGDADMAACLDDLDVYLCVARSLFAGARVPNLRPDTGASIDALLASVETQLPQLHALFNETPRTIDFSQFTVRGYYTRSELLSRYFRGMMWLGRIDFRLSLPNSMDGPPSVQREVVDAFLLRELVSTAQVGADLASVDHVIRVFVGNPDNTTLDDLDVMKAALGIADASDLWSTATYDAFGTLLATGDFQPQAINSRILLTDPMAGEPLQPPYAFLLMGQRFTVDSHVLGHVVYDQIVFEGEAQLRMLPDPLDILYALGNDDVLPLLRGELDTYHYAASLEALRYLVDAYEPEFWEQSLYTRWLHALRALAKTGDQAGAPEFMRTAAWQQEKMNTQLASWAELRHDTLLYVKQSYTSGVICSYPHGYVEPVPELFDRLEALGHFAHDELVGLGIPSWIESLIQGYYDRMATIMQTLGSIARKELAQTALSEAEQEFLRTPLYLDSQTCGTPERGWVRDLYFDPADWPVGTPDLIVADVHTQPTDEFGNPVGRVLHVGTSDPRLAVVVTGCPGATPVAYVGPVAAYHQHVTTNFTRLTDDAWETLLEHGLATGSPDWTWIYAADAEGAIRDDGRILDAGWTVGVDDPEDPDPSNPSRVPRIAWVENTPNPFNPVTVIGFEVQGSGRTEVRLRIYDLRGALLRDLLHETMPVGTWFTEWDGKDDRGDDVASGVYLAVVESAGRRLSTKMALVR